MRTGLIAAAVLVVMGQPALAQTEDAAPTPGTITVESEQGDTNPADVKQVFAEAVESALPEANFTALPGAGHGRYIARIRVTRSAKGSVASNAPAERAAGTVGNWGAQFHVALPSDKTQLHVLVVTELTVQILLRENMKPVWTGRALTAQAQGTRDDAPGVISKKLAEAVVRSFPAESADPVSVP